MEKILVTGGAGFVGAVLTDKLLDGGYKVKVLDNLMYGQTSHLPFFINPNFEFTRGDIRDKRVVGKAVKDVDIILHLAAIVGVPACKRSPKMARAVNLGGSKNILLSRSKDQPIIYASTGSNYGRVDSICTEESPLNPLSLYAKTKSQAEDEIMGEGNAIALRFATGFGISPRFRYDSLLINDFVYQAIKNKQLVVYEADTKRTFIHVQDMADSYPFSIKHLKEMRDKVYNVGSEKMNCTKRYVAEKIKEKIPFSLYFFDDAGYDEDKRNYDVSYDRIRKIGFETKITLEQGIDELINAFQNFPFQESQTANVG